MVEGITEAVPSIVIEGDLVRHLETRVVQEARLQDFLPHVEYRPPVMVGILPKTAIMVLWDESNPKRKFTRILAEKTPGVITAQNSNGAGTVRNYQISLPWTYFVFEFETKGDPMDGSAWMNYNTRVFWAREQVVDLDSQVGTALVPNCDGAGGICWGNTGVDSRLPLGVRVDRTVDEFYRTVFTHDSGTGSPWTSETKSVTWDRWEQETKKNPAAFLDFPEWKTPKEKQEPGRGRIIMQSVRNIMGKEFTERSTVIQAEGLIPPMVMPMTFGRAEELVREWTDTDRQRMATAITNVEAEIKAGNSSKVSVKTRVTAIGR